MIIRIPFLPRIVVLSDQDDIRKAELTAHLSHGVAEKYGTPLLPRLIRFLISWLAEHRDAANKQQLFFGFDDPTSQPGTPGRLDLRQDVTDRLGKVMEALKANEDGLADIVSYLSSDPSVPNNPQLETRARAQLANTIARLWYPEFDANSDSASILRNIDEIYPLTTLPLRWLFRSKRKKLKLAKENLEISFKGDNTQYHNIMVAMTLVWANITTLRQEINKSKFKELLKSGKWSPVSFCVQHSNILPVTFRTTICKTNLGGVVRRELPIGTIVVLRLSKVNDADGVFNHLCGGARFVQDLLTYLVDRMYPGLRKLPAEEGCPYQTKIYRPLY